MFAFYFTYTSHLQYFDLAIWNSNILFLFPKHLFVIHFELAYNLFQLKLE